MGTSQTTNSQSSGNQSSSSLQDKQVNQALQPYLNDILTQGQAFYNAGVGAQPYTGPTVAGQNRYLTDALGNYKNMIDYQMTAVGAHPQQLAIQGAENGLTPEMSAEISKLMNISGNPNGISTGGLFQNLHDQSLGQNANVVNGLSGLAGNAAGQNAGVISGLSGLAGSAAGQNADVVSRLAGMTGSDINPELRAVLDDQAARIGNRVNSSFSGMGRYGSAGNQDTLARSITAATAPVLAQAWEDQQNRALGANQAIAGIRQADTSLSGNLYNTLGENRRADTALGGSLYNTLGENRRADTAAALNAAQGLTGVQGQNIANQMNAANSALNAQNQAAQRQLNYLQMLPALTQLAYDPYQRQGDIGNWVQDRLQQEMNSSIGQYNNLQTMGWSQLAKYLGTISGAMPAFQGTGVTGAQSVGGTQSVGSSTTTTPFGPQQALGLGMSAVGKMSDIRLKTDIDKIGTHTMSGLDIYAYRYKGNPKHYPKVVGPMAQDAKEKFPAAIGEVDGTLYLKPEGAAAGGLLGL